MQNKAQNILSKCLCVLGWSLIGIYFLYLLITTLASGINELGIASGIIFFLFCMILGFGYFLKKDSVISKNIALIYLWNACLIAILFLVFLILLLFIEINDESAGQIHMTIFVGVPIFLASLLFHGYLLRRFYRDEKKKRSMKKDILAGVGVLASIFILIFFAILIVGYFGDKDTEEKDQLIYQENAVTEDSVEAIQSIIDRRNEWSIGLAFISLPEEYYDKLYDYTEIYDEQNDYLKALKSSEDTAIPSSDYAEFVIFRSSTNASDVHCIVETTETSMAVFQTVYFLQYKNGEIKNVSSDVFSIVDMNTLMQNSNTSIKYKRPDLVDQGLETNYYIQLPREGDTIKFVQYNTGETIYEIEWDGENFTVVD